MDRFRREAALQRTCDCERARPPARRFAPARPAAHRSSLGADQRAVAEPVVARRFTSATGTGRRPRYRLQISASRRRQARFQSCRFAIVVLLFATKDVWISPGQWGASVYFASLLAFFAILVLWASQRSDVALFFLGAHATLLFARALWLGDPLAIPLHQL